MYRTNKIIINNNIDIVLEEWNDLISHGVKSEHNDLKGLVKEIDKLLNDI